MAKQVIIDNPILNSPFEEPTRHFKSSDDGIINKVRSRVSVWRRRGRPGVTKTTARLVDHWIRPDREPALFFCQIEAAETAIYIGEAAGRFGDGWTEKLRSVLRQLGAWDEW